MNVLWITNITFPEAYNLMGYNQELKSSGGWMLGAAYALLKEGNVSLGVVSVSDKVNDFSRVQGGNILYYIMPYGKGNLRINSEYENYYRIIYEEFRPDIIHIFGTEYSHGLAYINACSNKNVVISIQGLTSIHHKYYSSGLSTKEIIYSLTFRDIIKGGINANKNDFSIRGEYEREMIRRVNHIIGRTSWDRAHTWAINPLAEYHFCNEILREEFYRCKNWSYQDCRKHSIFLSQASYPIKGLHQLLRAMPLILKHYPKACVRIAGDDITKHRGLGVIYHTGYGRLINKLIKKFNLKDRIAFVGNLDASQMIEEYLRANVFVCPSSIENSPNSLGEAQILGVPTIASYVGGVSDMMKENEEQMYRFEEIEMLAYKICDIFSKGGNIPDKRYIAQERHNPEKNAQQLLSIYSSILNS